MLNRCSSAAEKNGMNSSCTVAGFIGGALAALRRHCSLFARCGTKSQDNKVNGHDPNSMPGSTAGEIGETNSKAVYICIYVFVCVCVCEGVLVSDYCFECVRDLTGICSRD